MSADSLTGLLKMANPYESFVSFENIDAVVLERKIVSIILCANSSTKGNQPVHMRLFFVLDRDRAHRGKTSIEINSSNDGVPPGENGEQLTKLRIIFRRYAYSQGDGPEALTLASKPISVQKPNFYVKTMISLLLSKKRHRYMLDADSGSGCRYFCQVVLDDLIDLGWLNGNKDYNKAVEKLASRIIGNTLWDGVKLPKDAPQGTFF